MYIDILDFNFLGPFRKPPLGDWRPPLEMLIYYYFYY